MDGWGEDSDSLMENMLWVYWAANRHAYRGLVVVVVLERSVPYWNIRLSVVGGIGGSGVQLRE